MLNTKFHSNQPTGSRGEDFWGVFTIYGHGSHLGHVTLDPTNKLSLFEQIMVGLSPKWYI